MSQENTSYNFTYQNKRKQIRSIHSLLEMISRYELARQLFSVLMKILCLDCRTNVPIHTQRQWYFPLLNTTPSATEHCVSTGLLDKQNQIKINENTHKDYARKKTFWIIHKNGLTGLSVWETHQWCAWRWNDNKGALHWKRLLDQHTHAQ